jgi:CRISPR-associated protein Cst2
MWHLHGNILTEYGLASNNHDRNIGNLIPLPKIHWKGQIHTTVSAEAIKFAMRRFWQDRELSVNRTVNDENPDDIYHYKDDNFNPDLYIDDDVMGYLKIEKAQKNSQSNQAGETTGGDIDLQPEESSPKAKPKSNSKKNKAVSSKNQATTTDSPPEEKYLPKPKGKGIPRKGALDMSRAISTIPYDRDVLHSAYGGKKDSAALHSAQFHSTHYQYCFSITPNHLKVQERIFNVLEAINSLSRVGGSQSGCLYDFSPNSLILRWTHDPCSRHLYSIEAKHDEPATCPKLSSRMENGRIDPTEVWIIGDLAKGFKMKGVHLFENPAKAIEDLKQKMRRDLEL